MEKKKSADYFRGKEKYNCAQAVAKAFCDGCLIKEEDVEGKYKKMGSGKAEGGVCGSIAAARDVLNDKGGADRLETVVSDTAGSVKCREILKNMFHSSYSWKIILARISHKKSTAMPNLSMPAAASCSFIRSAKLSPLFLSNTAT